MTRDTCRYATCDCDPAGLDADGYTSRRFCSPQHEVKHEHIKADARDAERAARERHTDDRHPGERGAFL
jgi:hypothetical protein